MTMRDILDFEGGNMSKKRYFKFFGSLIRSGQAWQLQGMYGREAARLIEGGAISRKGRAKWKMLNSRGVDTNSMLYDE